MFEIIVFSLFIFIFGILPSIWYLTQKKKKNDGNLYILDGINTTFVLIINTFLVYLLTSNILYTISFVYLIPLLIFVIKIKLNPTVTLRGKINIVYYSSYLILFLAIILFFIK